MSSTEYFLAAASSVFSAKAARRLLAEHPVPAMIRVLALRADGLRVEHAQVSLEIAEAALETFRNLPLRLKRPGIGCIAWAAYGSSLRALARFDEAEMALAVAAKLTPRSRPDVKVDLMRRFAVLRAEQGKSRETQLLLASVLESVGRVSPRTLGQELANAGAIMMLIKAHRTALGHLEEALPLVADDRPRLISVTFNLASCRLHLASSDAELLSAVELTRRARSIIESGSYSELKLRWLDGKLQHRLENFDASLELFESARRGIEERGDGYDRALLVLDIAELHLDRGELERAHELARSSFGVLAALRKDDEAYQAMQVFYRAGVALALDRAMVDRVRERLVDLQRRPRPAE